MESSPLATRMENGECELIMDRLMTCSRPLCLLACVDYPKVDLICLQVIVSTRTIQLYFCICKEKCNVIRDTRVFISIVIATLSVW